MKWIGTTSIALIFGAVGVACSGGGGTSSGGDDARIGAVHDALTQPTASVSVASARALGVDWQSWQRVRAAFDSILFIGTDTAKACLAGSEDAGAYDLSCLTLGHVRGRLTFHARLPATDAGLQGRVEVKLEDACLDDACVNAEASLEIIPSDCAALATLAVVATVSRGGESESFAFGAQGGIGRGELIARVVYFDAAGRSLIVEGEGGPGEAGPFLVTGANGSFECSFLGAGRRCDGATSFTL